MADKSGKGTFLEEQNRERLKKTEEEVRRNVVEDRKKELGRTLRDLDDMLQKLHAENQKRMKEYQVLYSNESDMRGQLDELQAEIESLLKVDPEKCRTDEMATISSKIEATRRNILRIELGGSKNAQNGVSVPGASEATFNPATLNTKQLIKCGFAFTAPLIFSVLLAAVVVAVAIASVFAV